MISILLIALMKVQIDVLVWAPVALSHIRFWSPGENIPGIYHYVPNSLMCRAKIYLALAPRAQIRFRILPKKRTL